MGQHIGTGSPGGHVGGLRLGGGLVDGSPVGNRQDPAFQPQKLSRRDLCVTVTPQMRVLPTHVIAEETERRRAQLERFRVHSPRFRLRLKHYLLGSLVFFPLMTWLFTPVGLMRLWLQLPLAALLGLALAYMRPRGTQAMLLMLLFGLVNWFIVGGLPIGINNPGVFLLFISACLIHIVAGGALGAAESLNSLDG